MQSHRSLEEGGRRRFDTHTGREPRTPAATRSRKRQRTDSPLEPVGVQPWWHLDFNPVMMILDFQPLNSWEHIFLWLKAARFVEICYGSHRKPIHTLYLCKSRINSWPDTRGTSRRFFAKSLIQEVRNQIASTFRLFSYQQEDLWQQMMSIFPICPVPSATGQELFSSHF